MTTKFESFNRSLVLQSQFVSDHQVEFRFVRTLFMKIVALGKNSDYFGVIPYWILDFNVHYKRSYILHI